MHLAHTESGLLLTQTWWPSLWAAGTQAHTTPYPGLTLLPRFHSTFRSGTGHSPAAFCLHQDLASGNTAYGSVRKAPHVVQAKPGPSHHTNPLHSY